MKIAYIQYGNVLNPFSHGGLGRAVHAVLKKLAKHHEIVVFTGPQGPERVRTVDGVCYSSLCSSGGRWSSRIEFMIRSFFLDLNKYDLILLVWTRYAPPLVRTRSRPAILELHSDFFIVPPKNMFIDAASRFLFRRACRKLRHVISISSDIRERVAALNPGLITNEIIHNGIDDEIFAYRNRPGREDYLLFMGRLDIRIKGIDILLKAYRLSGTSVPLKIAGNGADQKKIEELIGKLGLEDKVHLVGWVDGQAKLELINNCLCLCVPSREEGWGMVASDAAALGKPVIASRIGGLKEIVSDQKTGILVDIDDIAGYKNAILRMLNDPEFRLHLGKNARECAQEYTWDKSAKKRERIFSQIVTQDFPRF